MHPLANDIPESRVHFSMAIGPLSAERYIVVYGGYDRDGSFRDDLNIYDIRFVPSIIKRFLIGTEH
jgi:hypothetical protein